LKEYLKRYYDEFKGLYSIYNYGYIDSKFLVYLYTLKSFVNDREYLKSLLLNKKEKFKWLKYSLIRNYNKYLGAYLATKYLKSDNNTKNKLDEKFSQQKRQIES